jgi:hypothetical protein
MILLIATKLAGSTKLNKNEDCYGYSPANAGQTIRPLKLIASDEIISK